MKRHILSQLPRSLMRSILICILAVSIVVVTQIVRNAPVGAEEVREQSNPYEDLEGVEDAVDALVEEYHERVNDAFNERIKKLVLLGNEGTPEKLETLLFLVTPPAMEKDAAGLPGKRHSCATFQNNLSTYCLATAMTKEYFDFRASMLDAREAARVQAGQRFETLKQSGIAGNEGDAGAIFEQRRMIGGTVGDIKEGQESIQNYGAVINRVDRELDIARKALDQSLAAYNELQMALPMHIKYKQVVSALEKYRDKISKVRQKTDVFPTNFLDVTTAACT